MDLRAIQDRVLITPIFKEYISGAGIFLGEGEMSDIGLVLAVGPGRTTAKGNLIPMGVEVGTKVLFTMGVGAQVKAGRERILVLRECDILAVQE